MAEYKDQAKRQILTLVLLQPGPSVAEENPEEVSETDDEDIELFSWNSDSDTNDNNPKKKVNEGDKQQVKGKGKKSS